MLITVESPDAHQYRIYDCEGSAIPFVVSFDTETKDIELSVRVVGKKSEEGGEELCMLKQLVVENGENQHAPVIIKFNLPGAYALKDG